MAHRLWKLRSRRPEGPQRSGSERASWAGTEAAMSKRAISAVTIVFFLVLIAVAVVLWVLAYRVEADAPAAPVGTAASADKTRAALVATAGAVTGGVLAALGGWFNSWRAGAVQEERERAQREREERAAREVAYRSVVNIAGTFVEARDRYQRNFTAWEKAKRDGVNSEANLAAAKDHWDAATSARRALSEALRAAAGVSRAEDLRRIQELQLSIDSLAGEEFAVPATQGTPPAMKDFQWMADSIRAEA